MRIQVLVRGALQRAGVEKPGPTAIARRLGMDKSLAWKLGRMASSPTPLQAFEFVPGRAGVVLILEALAAVGADPGLGGSLDLAFRELAEVVLVHAGDRATARAMARATLPAQRPELGEVLRREHFRTASEIWGAQARVQVKADFFAPGLRKGQIDMAAFEGLQDLLRLRPDVSWSIGSKRVTKSANPHPTVFRALKPGGIRRNEAPLFHGYCSDPLPKLRQELDADGSTHFELSPNGVGRRGAVTCLIATYCKSVIELDPPPMDNNLIAIVDLRTPVELLVFDLFVHRSLVKKGAVRVELLGQLKKADSFGNSGVGQPLPVPIRAKPLGTGPGEQVLDELPGYSAAVGEAFELASGALRSKHWKREDFMGLRVKLAYPPIPSVAVVRIPLNAPR